MMEMAVIGVFLHFFFFFFFFFFFKSVCLIVLMVLVVYADDHQWWSWQFRTCVHNDHDSSESMFRKINNFVYWPNKAFTSSSVATHIVTCGCHYTCQCVCVCVCTCVCVCVWACLHVCVHHWARKVEGARPPQAEQPVQLTWVGTTLPSFFDNAATGSSCPVYLLLHTCVPCLTNKHASECVHVTDWHWWLCFIS